MTNRFAKSIAIVFSLPTMAHAHPGHDFCGFTGGVAHPLLGVDHLLVLLAVGMWAAQLGGRARWALPFAFVGAMGIGVACGLTGFSVPLVEQSIIGSVLVFGVLVAAGARLPLIIAFGVVVAFAFMHGVAHGAEMPVAAGKMSYCSGLLLCTAILQGAGLVLGMLLERAGHTPWLRTAGALICLFGVFLVGA